VYSSFYFSNACFERLRRGVREAEAGMAVLAHYSVPDSEELANGVGSLLPLGAHVLEHEGEYVDLMTLFSQWRESTGG
jgi:hypothetical protein